MSYIVNPLGKPFDYYQDTSSFLTTSAGDLRYLKLDQSTPQTVTASPILDWGTAGRIPFFSATKALTDSAGLFWDATNSRLGIGTASPSYPLHVVGNQYLESGNLGIGALPYQYGGAGDDHSINTSRTFTDITDGTYKGSYVGEIYWNPDIGSVTQYVRGLTFSVNSTPGNTANNTGYFQAMEASSLWRSDGTITHDRGLVAKAGTYNGVDSTSGTVTNASAFYGYVTKATGSTITNAYGLNLQAVAGTTNAYGVYINNVSATNAYDIYANDASAKNYFAGNVGIGTTSPSALIHGIKTTEQLRLGYDTANYASFTVDSTGILTISPTLYTKYTKRFVVDYDSTGAATQNALTFYHDVTPASSSGFTMRGIQGFTRSYGTQNITGTIQGFQGGTIHNSTGTLASAIGGDFYCYSAGSCGTTTSAKAVQAQLYTEATRIITSGYNIFIATPTNSGTLTNTYGLYIASQTNGTQTNTPFSVYQAGTADRNYFAGLVGIGTTAPGEKLHVVGNTLLDDNYKSLYGTSKNASIYHNGTDLIIDPDEVGSGILRIGANISCKSTGTLSEKFGESATATGYASTAIGNNALAYRNFSTSIGCNSQAGIDAYTAGTKNMAVGYLATAGASSLAIGATAFGTCADSEYDAAFAMGYFSRTTAANQFVCGGPSSDSAWIDNVFFGSGVTDIVPKDVTFHATGGFGSNCAGASLIISGGISTGTGAGGDIIFYTTPAGASGSDANTPAERLRITTDNKLTAPGDLTIKCGAAKTVVLEVPVYKDINLGSAALQLAASNNPGLDEFVNESGVDTGITTYAFAPTEFVSGSFEIQHDYKEGTDLTFHVHWQGITAPDGETDNVKWQLIYTVARDGATLDATTTIVKESAITTQYMFVQSSFTAITGTNFKIGDQFLFRLARVAASSDEYAGDALLATCGVHYQIDTLGSRSITAK